MYAPVNEPRHDIGGRRGTGTMRDDDGGAVLGQGTQRRKDARRRRHVEAAQGVVQHQRRGIPQRGTCQAQPLPLASRYRRLVQGRVMAVRQAPDECVRLHASRSGLDLDVAGIAAERDCIPDGVA